MIYTAYSEEQYKDTPKIYRKEILGVSYLGDILQLPICPECGGYMIEDSGFLSCIECGNVSKKRVIKE